MIGLVILVLATALATANRGLVYTMALGCQMMTASFCYVDQSECLLYCQFIIFDLFEIFCLFWDNSWLSILAKHVHNTLGSFVPYMDSSDINNLKRILVFFMIWGHLF